MSHAAAAALPRHRVALGRPAALLAAILAVAGLAAVLPVHHAGSPPEGAARTTASTAAALAALPLATQLTMARTVAADLPAYALRATPAGAVGATPAQHLSERFDRTGVTVTAGAHRFRLAVRTLSGGGATIALPAAAPATRANRVTYARGPVTEWFDNSALGLEQSFRIAAAPAAGARTLTLGLTLGSPTLTTRAAGRTGLALVDAHGTTVLRYRGLVAHDAGGRALPAAMHRTTTGAALTVDTAGARYPVTIDPVVQQGRLTASDGVAYQHVGSPVAISGDTIAVGSPSAVIGGNTQGAVYVFTKPAGGWRTGTQVAKLYASDAAAGGNSTSNVYGDTLGTSVAISGDTIVAGAPRATLGDPSAGGQPYAGKLYVFVKPAGAWAPAAFQTAELAATDATTYDYLGTAVATDGTTIVGGAPRAGSLEHGAAYVYTKPAGGWTSATQTARLTGSDIASDGDFVSDSYASAVAVSGSQVAVGAPYAQSGKGAVYTYKKPGGEWADNSETAKLTSSPQVAGETLGVSLAMDATTLVAGAPNNYNPGSADPSVYVFPQPAGGWTGPVSSSVRLTQNDNATADHFGGSVSISGTTITASSAYTAGPPPGPPAGSTSSPAPGRRGRRPTSPRRSAGATDGNVQQAASVAVSGTTVVSSAPYAKVGSNNEQGAAYVFDTSGAGPGTGRGGGDPGGGGTTTPIPPPAPPAPVDDQLRPDGDARAQRHRLGRHRREPARHRARLRRVQQLGPVRLHRGVQAARRLQGHDHLRPPEAGARLAPVGGRRRQGEEERRSPTARRASRCARARSAS